jgi:hypothetical protein
MSARAFVFPISRLRLHLKRCDVAQAMATHGAAASSLRQPCAQGGGGIAITTPRSLARRGSIAKHDFGLPSAAISFNSACDCICDAFRVAQTRVGTAAIDGHSTRGTPRPDLVPFRCSRS